MATSITVNNNISFIDETLCENLENDLENTKKFPSATDAKDALCSLCQAGATNKAQGNLSITWVDSTSNTSSGSGTTPLTIKLTLKEVKDILQKGKYNFTLRQYARTRAQECHDVGLQYGIPGDLYKKLQHMYGPISKEDSFWCSSFQMNTDVCPQHVKELLIKHYNATFKVKP